MPRSGLRNRSGRRNRSSSSRAAKARSAKRSARSRRRYRSAKLEEQISVPLSIGDATTDLFEDKTRRFPFLIYTSPSPPSFPHHSSLNPSQQGSWKQFTIRKEDLKSFVVYFRQVKNLTTDTLTNNFEIRAGVVCSKNPKYGYQDRNYLFHDHALLLSIQQHWAEIVNSGWSVLSANWSAYHQERYNHDFYGDFLPWTNIVEYQRP